MLVRLACNKGIGIPNISMPIKRHPCAPPGKSKGKVSNQSIHDNIDMDGIRSIASGDNAFSASDITRSKRWLPEVIKLEVVRIRLCGLSSSILWNEKCKMIASNTPCK